jgi:hypothetical protein
MGYPWGILLTEVEELPKLVYTEMYIKRRWKTFENV